MSFLGRYGPRHNIATTAFVKELCNAMQPDLSPQDFRAGHDQAYVPKAGARVMDLQDETKKMSKSSGVDGAAGTVYLTDSDKTIERKIMRAVTDSGERVRDEANRPGIDNLLTIYAALTDRTMQCAHEDYEGEQYGVLKKDVAECVVSTVRPIREKIESLNKDTDLSRSFLKRDADRASVVAQKTLDKVYEKVGLV